MAARGKIRKLASRLDNCAPETGTLEPKQDHSTQGRKKQITTKAAADGLIQCGPFGFSPDDSLGTVPIWLCGTTDELDNVAGIVMLG